MTEPIYVYTCGHQTPKVEAFERDKRKRLICPVCGNGHVDHQIAPCPMCGTMHQVSTQNWRPTVLCDKCRPIAKAWREKKSKSYRKENPRTEPGRQRQIRTYKVGGYRAMAASEERADCAWRSKCVRDHEQSNVLPCLGCVRYKRQILRLEDYISQTDPLVEANIMAGATE